MLPPPGAKMALPKHPQHHLSAAHINALLPRPTRRKREYFVERETGESARDWVQRNLEDSLGCYLMDVVMATLSAFIVVYNAYSFWGGVVFISSKWMIGVFAIHVYAVFDRVDYMRNLKPIAEFIILLPSWLRWFVDLNIIDLHRSLDIVEVSLVLCSLRVLRLFRFLDFTTSSLQYQVLAVFVTIVCIVISTTGILQVVEACFTECKDDEETTCRCQNLSYLDLLYFVVVSISTLGYGDIYLLSTNGKFLISFVILLTFIVVPIQINRVSKIISSHTDYTSSYKEAKQHPHVVITGHIDVEMLSVFFGEFFHSSNLNWNEKIVILNPSPPAVEAKKMLNMYENKVQYIVGSPMLDEDLARAMLHKASACYVLVNRNAFRPQHADQCSALTTIALRRGNPTCPIYSEVINTENAGTILKLGASDVLIAGLMKFSILGRSSEMFGLPTLLLNMLTQSHAELSQRVSPILWQNSYLHGVMHGLYVIDIPRTFSGLSFGDLIRFLYNKTPVIPLALLTEDGVQFPDMEFKLGATADPNLCCKVYALAKGLTAVEEALRIPPEQILSYRKNNRRKAKSSMDLHHLTPDSTKKKSKPALGSDFEKIRQSLIAMYTPPERPRVLDDDDRSREYVDFTSAGVPPDIAKHIIVCGFPTDTYQFLKTIREAPSTADNGDESDSSPVVFLAPAVIDEDEFAKIRHLDDVYFVMGSPVNFADLKKTRIDVAVSVLILTLTSEESQYSDPNMVDADAITTLRYIVEISQKSSMPNLVVELARPTNVKLLSSLSTDHRMMGLTHPVAAISHQISYRTPRCASSRRDSFWGGLDDSANGGSDASLVLEEYIASGRVYMNSIIDSLMSECYRKPWIMPFVHILINGCHNDPENKRLFQLEAPETFVALSYATCFRKFLEQASCVAIGIWRPERGAVLPHPCVFINPPHDLETEPGDLFFLVGRPITDAKALEFFVQ
ncbi:Calcium-activated potassium channel subunit alpha-1, partial [Globisporangium splendens]